MHNLFLPCGQSLLTQILRFAQDDSFFAQDDSFASLRLTASLSPLPLPYLCLNEASSFPE